MDLAEMVQAISAELLLSSDSCPEDVVDEAIEQLGLKVWPRHTERERERQRDQQS